MLLNPQSFNRYSYASNSPLRLVDPTGMDDCVIGKTCSFTTTDWATSGNHPEEGQIQESVTVAIPPTQAITTTSAEPGAVSLTPKALQMPLVPGGDEPSDRPDENIVEQYVSDPVQTALEVVNWLSEGISDAAYAVAPDYVYLSGGIPLVAGGGLQFSKDGHLYVSLAGPTAGATNFKLGLQGGAAYFATTKMTEQQRENSIMGPGSNISTPFTPFGTYIPDSGTPAVTIGGPFSAGVNRSTTWRIF